MAQGLDQYGVDEVDCETCFETATNSFCMPYEQFTGVDVQDSLKGSCCDHSASYACNNFLDKTDPLPYLCDNQISADLSFGTETTTFLPKQTKRRAFCAYNKNTCYIGGLSSSPSDSGKVLFVKEHEPMLLGTTPDFKTSSVCSWLL